MAEDVVVHAVVEGADRLPLTLTLIRENSPGPRLSYASVTQLGRGHVLGPGACDVETLVRILTAASFDERVVSAALATSFLWSSAPTYLSLSAMGRGYENSFPTTSGPIQLGVSQSAIAPITELAFPRWAWNEVEVVERTFVHIEQVNLGALLDVVVGAAERSGASLGVVTAIEEGRHPDLLDALAIWVPNASYLEQAIGRPAADIEAALGVMSDLALDPEVASLLEVAGSGMPRESAGGTLRLARRHAPPVVRRGRGDSWSIQMPLGRRIREGMDDLRSLSLGDAPPSQ